ncbi:MAG TPA: transketolase C-terminal domain-containing protein [Pirellulales bacterium]|jgi:transketolase C-terminal domain/subunit|nr:transketolase C-terminal domain-containing protein [Pirellulales bacterium]
MANVSDLILWRSTPLTNLSRKAGDAAAVVPATHRREFGLSQDDQPVNEELEAVELSTVLRSLFESGRDQVVWNLSGAVPEGQPYLRLDPRHGFAPAIVRSLCAATGHREQVTSLPPWLIIVGEAREILHEDNLDQLRSAILQVERTLIVACDHWASAATAASQKQGARRVRKASSLLGCQYAGPVQASDGAELGRAISELKQAGRPAILYLRIDEADALAHAESLVAPTARPTTDTYLQVCVRELAQAAKRDPRVLLVASQVDQRSLAPWKSLSDRVFSADSGVPHALAWSASLASAGNHPFALLSAGELENCLGELRRELVDQQAAVTLVVCPDAANPAPSSATLAGLRQMTDLAIVSPANAGELRQMLAWSAAQGGPSLIWLPQAAEPCASFTPGATAPIHAGRADWALPPGDVLIVSWGSTTAAACEAANRLGEVGLKAGVLEARFAQPLDVETLTRAARQALCVVIVDDSQQTGGFGGWILECLVREGVSQPIWIVAADTSSPTATGRLSAAILERCSWLADPIVPDGPAVSAAPPSTMTSCPPAPHEPPIGLAGDGELAQEEREQVLTSELSADVKRWVAQYEELGRRDLYLWKWCMHGVEITTLPSVRADLRAHVCDTKLLSIVLCVLLDDVADQHGNSQLLETLLEITPWDADRPHPALSDAERRYAGLTRALWAEYWARVASYPCTSTFEPVLRYDLLQFFNTMRYSHLVNSRPYLLNMSEHDLYTSHNMMMISFATLDLMCSPSFPLSEVGALREMMWHAQCMGRIGNLLSTWRRELAQHDFTSGVFARALLTGDLSLPELEWADHRQIEATIRDRGHEAHFYQKWLDHRGQCRERARAVRSIDLSSVLDGHDRFLAMHLGSKGLI